MGFFGALAPAIGGVASLLMSRGGAGGAFGGGSVSQAAMPYLNRMPEYAHKAYDQHINRGNQSSDALQSLYGQLSGNPGDYLNQITSQYKPSQGYQFRRQQLGKDLSNSAAAAGLLGTYDSNANMGGLLDGILGQDEQRYIDNYMNILGQGTQGQENMADRGFKADSYLADYLGGVAGSQASLKGGEAMYRNQNQNNLFNQILKSGSQMFGARNGNIAQQGYGVPNSFSSFLGR